MGRTRYSGPVEARLGFLHSESILYEEDFIGAGALVIPVTASPESGMDWTSSITGAAPPTGAGEADTHGGKILLSLTSASQAQNSALVHGNQRNFDVRKGGFIEGRVTVPTLPTLLGKLVFGLGADVNADADSVTHSIWFAVTSAGLLLETDDSSTDSVLDTGIDIVAADVIAWRIDFRDLSDIKFYVSINPTSGEPIVWNRLGVGSRFAFSDATAADNILQPYFAACKASGAGLGVLGVDSVTININR